MQSEQSPFARRSIQVQLVIWAAFVVLLYYFKDNNRLADLREDLPRLGQALWNVVFAEVLWVVGFMIVGYGLGRAVLELTRISNDLDTVEDDILFSLAVGWGLLGLGAFGLGSLGFLQWWLHIGIAAVIVGATHRQLLHLWRRLRSSFKEVDLSQIEWLIAITIFTIGAWGLSLCFLPEYGIDALNSHLPAPAAYLQEGRITFHPEINFNNFPQTVEMWFMESMMLIPEGAGALLMGVCHLLTALAVYSMTRKFFGRGPALVAVLIYLLMKKVYRMATVAYIDQGLTLMLVLGMYGLLLYLEKPSTRKALLTGAVLGFACGIKYSAFITAALVAIVAIAYALWNRRNFVRLLIDFALAAVVLLIVCSPWYIRNWVWFHNPFFPFYSSVFPPNGGVYGDLAQDLMVDHREMLHMFAPENPRDPVLFLTLPFTIAFGQFGPYEAHVGAIGPWTLVTLPLVVFLKRWPKIVWAILGLIFATFAWWWFVEGMLMLRYMLPIFSISAVISGWLAWDGLRLENIRAGSVYGFLGFSLAFLLLVSFFTGVVTPDEVRGKMPLMPNARRDFVNQLFPAMPVFDALNETFEEAGIEDNVRVYAYTSEQYRWRCNFKLIGNQVGYADYQDYMARAGDAAAVYSWLRSYDIHFLVVNYPYAYLNAGEEAQRAIPSLWPGWETYFDELNTDYYVYVYQLK